MATRIDAYEQLRAAVVLGQARPEGLAAVVYHGLLGGLKAISAMVRTPNVVSPQVLSGVAPASAPTDPALLRLLANMVLHYAQESTHVF